VWRSQHVTASNVDRTTTSWAQCRVYRTTTSRAQCVHEDTDQTRHWPDTRVLLSETDATIWSEWVRLIPLTCLRTALSPSLTFSCKVLFPSLVLLLARRRVPDHCPEPWMLLVWLSCCKEQSFNSPIIRLLTSETPLQYA
jgi:hypothetical protein